MSKSRIGLFEFYTSLFSTKDGPRKFSLKRAIKLFFLLPLFEVLRVTNRLFLALDNIIFPSFSSIKIEKPVMIVSMPRCGTTYLHHTLANHDETFTTMKLWELIFAPSFQCIHNCFDIVCKGSNIGSFTSSPFSYCI